MSNLTSTRIRNLRTFAKRAKYTHFEKAERNFLLVFALDKCEVCEDTLQAANAIKVVGTQHEALSAGLIEMRAPDEGGWSDLHGCGTCSACNEDPDAGKKDANLDVTTPCNMQAILADHNAL